MNQLVDPALYDTDPENAWRRLKPRKHAVKYLAVFRAVAAWRERTAQQRDQPPGLEAKGDLPQSFDAVREPPPDLVEPHHQRPPANFSV